MKPWFVTVFSRHTFTIDGLAAQAGVGESAIVKMLNGKPVAEGVATHVLATLAGLTNKPYSLGNVEVALMAESASEVARLLTAINGEYEAATSGISGLAQGVSRHDFINKRMESIADQHALAGDEVAP